MRLWAIQRISDGLFLPSGKRPSWIEIDDGGPPRLFRTKAGADACLRNWCKGYWRTTSDWEATDEYGGGFYYQGLPGPIGKGMRDRAAHRIVEIKLEVL